MAKKVNWFEADKAMSERVAEYIRCKGEITTLRSRREDEIKGLQARLARYNDPDRVVIEDAEKRQAYIASVEKELEDTRAAYKALIEETATFEYTAADKALYSKYLAGDLAGGIIEWVKTYSKEGKVLDIADTENLAMIVSDCGGRKGTTARQFVQSEGKSFLRPRGRDEILKVFYGSLAEQMIAAGTLKPYQFPEEIRAKYAPKARAKKADK